MEFRISNLRFRIYSVRIKNIQIWDFRPSFIDGPYAMAGVIQETTRGRIIRMETECGLAGLGEVVFSPYIEPDEIESVISQETTSLASGINEDICVTQEVIEAFQCKSKAWRSFAFGLETAVFDILSQEKNISLGAYLSENCCNPIHSYLSRKVIQKK